MTGEEVIEQPPEEIITVTESPLLGAYAYTRLAPGPCTVFPLT